MTIKNSKETRNDVEGIKDDGLNTAMLVLLIGVAR